jgi:hypothetical protein
MNKSGCTENLPDVGELVELFVAVLARVLLRAEMRALVLMHVPHLFELLLAVGTLVGILARVQLALVGPPREGGGGGGLRAGDDRKYRKIIKLSTNVADL